MTKHICDKNCEQFYCSALWEGDSGTETLHGQVRCVGCNKIFDVPSQTEDFNKHDCGNVNIQKVQGVIFGRLK